MFASSGVSRIGGVEGIWYVGSGEAVKCVYCTHNLCAGENAPDSRWSRRCFTRPSHYLFFCEKNLAVLIWKPAVEMIRPSAKDSLAQAVQGEAPPFVGSEVEHLSKSAFRYWGSCLSRHSSGSTFTYAHGHFQARTEVMSSPLIQNNAYYGVSSDLYGPSFGLSDGPKTDPPQPLFLTKSSLRSLNWQIFYQDTIYLIRNFDYGTEYQLGVPEDSPTVPALLPASGNLTQQWNITLWSDGTYRLTNMWLGNVQILGVSDTDNNKPIPVMTAAQ